MQRSHAVCCVSVLLLCVITFLVATHNCAILLCVRSVRSCELRLGFGTHAGFVCGISLVTVTICYLALWDLNEQMNARFVFVVIGFCYCLYCFVV